MTKNINIILNLLSSACDNVRDIEIVGVDITNDIINNDTINVSFRTLDWNHSFKLKFNGNGVTVYHNNGIVINSVYYELSNGFSWVNNRMIDFILYSINKNIIPLDDESRYSYDERRYSYVEIYRKLFSDIKMNVVVNDIVDFLKEENMHVHSYGSTPLIINHGWSTFSKRKGNIRRVGMYILSSDWNIHYKIEINSSEKGEYFCKFIENSLGGAFFSTGEFPIEEFAKRVPKFVKRRYSLRPVNVISYTNVADTILAYFSSDSSN